MGKAYGIADPMALIGARDAGSNQTCTAGADTTVMTFSTAAAISAGFYYPVIFGAITLLMGATAPSALSLKSIINAGAAFNTYVVPPALLVNNGTLLIPIIFVGSASATVWFPGPATLTLVVNPTAQNVTYTDATSTARMFLFRGPDA